MVGRPSRRSGSGRETLPEVQRYQETLPESGTGRETLPEVRKWLADPPGGPEIVGRPSQRSGSGRKTLSVVR